MASDTAPRAEESAAAAVLVGGQAWDADVYARNARFVADLAVPLVALLAPQPGEQILDLGCGDGALTAVIAASGAEVLGVDAAPAMVAAAQARGLNVARHDGHALPFAARFDGVFSNAALHWMRDPEVVLAGVARALKPGGRFVGEMAGAGNIACIQTAMVAEFAARGRDGAALVPWYFPTLEEYRARLEQAGLVVQEITLFPRPTLLPTGLDGWLDTFAGMFLAALPEAEQPAFRAAVATATAPQLRHADGRWWADYVRLRFVAIKPYAHG